MAIRRNGSTSKTFRVGLNVTLDGSKKMTPEQQDAALTVGQVRVLIIDAEDENSVLVDEILDITDFNTGSAGYKLHGQGFRFRTA